MLSLPAGESQVKESPLETLIIIMSASELYPKLFEDTVEGEASASLCGSLPSWLDAAVVIYNGPVGIWNHPKGRANHWFDGLGALTRIALSGGNVKATVKLLRSDAQAKAGAHGKLISTEYGSPGAADPEKVRPS